MISERDASLIDNNIKVQIYNNRVNGIFRTFLLLAFLCTSLLFMFLSFKYKIMTIIILSSSVSFFLLVKLIHNSYSFSKSIKNLKIANDLLLMDGKAFIEFYIEDPSFFNETIHAVALNYVKNMPSKIKKKGGSKYISDVKENLLKVGRLKCREEDKKISLKIKIK